MNVSLADVLAGAAAHAVPLSAECAGYLVLAAADQASHAPRRVFPADLELCADGGVRVARTPACDERDAEIDLRALLEELLLAASSVTPALLRAGRRAGTGSIASLLREIETALIPVNRAAARRALARLQRETARALESGKLRAERIESARPGPLPSEPVRSPSPLVHAASPPPPVAQALPVALKPRTPAPVAVATPVPPVVPTPAPASVPAPVSPRAHILTVPDDPVPPPTPRPAAKLAPEPLVPSLSPPPVASVARVEAETRPEPVVLRASSRPTAPPPPETKTTTPVLGTLVAERSFLPDDLELVYLDEGETEEELAGADLTEYCPPVYTDDGDDQAASAHYELLDQDEAPLPSLDQGEPSPTPLMLTERIALPIVPEIPRVLAVLDVPELAPPVIDEPEPSPLAELARQAEIIAAAPAETAAETAQGELPIEEIPLVEAEELPIDFEPDFISEIGLAVLVESRSELPAWAAPAAPELEQSPPPRLALPKALPSDVDDLLGRLNEAPLAVDDLRTGLKRLAGIELTPPPLGVTRE